MQVAKRQREKLAKRARVFHDSENLRDVGNGGPSPGRTTRMRRRRG